MSDKKMSDRKRSDAKANWSVWDSFQRAAIVLLATCAILLAANAVLTWVYLSSASERFARALSAMEDSNTRLDMVRGELDSNLKAIRDELHALNQKASDTADVTPPGNDASQ